MDSADRLFPYTLCFPGLSERTLQTLAPRHRLSDARRLGPKSVPLEYRRIPAAEARRLPLVSELADPDQLLSLATFREYMLDWPERFCIDAVLDAERMGAVVRNFTTARLLERDAQGRWQVGLSEGSATATVTAAVVLNMAGIWIDRVNQSAQPETKRLILGTKGSHIVVKLPAAYRDFGIATVNSIGEGYYCLPSQGGYHHIGPTETVYEGDIDDIRVNRLEIDFLLAETKNILPGPSARAKGTSSIAGPACGH